MLNQDCKYEATTLKYLAGRLPKDEISGTEAHIAQCTQCCETMAHLSRITIPQETFEEKLFLDSNIKNSEQAIRQLIAANLTSSKDNVFSINSNKVKPFSKFFFNKKTKLLVLAASLAILFLIGVSSSIWQKPISNSTPLIAQNLEILEQLNRSGRITEFRLTGISYAPFIENRGTISASESESLSKVRLHLEGIITSNPTPSNRHALAKVLFSLKEYDLAIIHLSQAAKDDSTNPSIFNDLALIAATKKDYNTALLNIDKALKINSNYLVGIFNRAMIYQKLTNYKAARSDWEAYLRLDSTSSWAKEAKNNLNFIKQQPL